MWPRKVSYAIGRGINMAVATWLTATRASIIMIQKSVERGMACCVFLSNEQN